MFKKIASVTASAALAVGGMVVLAGPAAAEQPNMVVHRNVGTYGGGLGGNIAYSTQGRPFSERLMAPDTWQANHETSSIAPYAVAAGGGYCVYEDIRMANSQDPADRTWRQIVVVLHGQNSARKLFKLKYHDYTANNGLSVETRWKVVAC